jgi:SAM-dependent methyltransferase
MRPEEVREHKAFGKNWFHAIELAPDLYSRKPRREPVALTRELLRRTDVESGGVDGGGARCLDVGLQEGLVTLLMERRGASEVLGYDLLLRSDRLELVQKALDARFGLIGGMSLAELPRAMAEAGHGPFDVAVFSGVLYHMFDPLTGLAVVRGLVRDGGICLVETATVLDDSARMFFNTHGVFTAGGRRSGGKRPRPEGMMPGSATCFWYLTPRCLDYLLRMLRFEPVDLVYFDTAEAIEGKPPEARVAVACRAITEPLAEPDDEWLAASQRHRGQFSEFLDWERVRSEAPPVDYDASREGLVRGGAGSVDLHASIAATEPFAVDVEGSTLPLGAKF